MARKSFSDLRASALAEIESAKKRLAKLEAEAGERIGKLAVKCGLVDLDLSDEELSREFDAIASKFRSGKNDTSRTTAETAAAG